MLPNREIPPFVIKFPMRLIFLACLGAGLGLPVQALGKDLRAAQGAEAQGTDVDLQGTVMDATGAPIAGAAIKLLESSLATTSDADGKFALKGNVAIGILHRTRLPGNLGLTFRDGVVTLERPLAGGMRVEWIDVQGHRLLLPVPAGSGSFRLDLAGLGHGRNLRGSSGPDPDRSASDGPVHWLRITTASGSAVFRFVQRGSRSFLSGGPGLSGAPGVLEKAAAAATASRSVRTSGDGFILEAAAAGFLAKRFAQASPVKSGLALNLLPAASGLKERIQDFLGAGNSFKIAYLKPEAAGSRKFMLYYSDFAEMAGDTMPQHAFPDSKGPASSVYGAFAPSWSPDGRTIAYETGYENLTTPISRIYLQPVGGARADGPAYPATNPRWWTDGKDTSLIWCSSGREDAWADTSSATYRQKISGGVLTGAAEVLSKGSYNAGLSPDGRYLATAFRYALMQDRNDKAKRYLHIYPGHPKAADGSNTDSLQACNGSVSQDPAHPSRMLFLDFGVPEAPAYPNGVVPGLYAQHRMILIGDYASDAPGRIVDFIDTPESELAVDNTWDDPEWTTHADFAVATTRDPDGDKSEPSQPKPTQPAIYLIKLSTKESIKVLSGGHQMLPAAWVGAKP